MYIVKRVGEPCTCRACGRRGRIRAIGDDQEESRGQQVELCSICVQIRLENMNDKTPPKCPGREPGEPNFYYTEPLERGPLRQTFILPEHSLCNIWRNECRSSRTEWRYPNPPVIQD